MIYIVFEYDWETQIPIKAFASEATANEFAKTYEAQKRASASYISSVWGVGVEDLEYVA